MNCLQCKHATNFQPGRFKGDMSGVVPESRIMTFACTLNCCHGYPPVEYFITLTGKCFEPRKG